VFYGLAPLALVLYLLNTPGRRRRLNAQMDTTAKHPPSEGPQLGGYIAPNAGGETPTDAIAPVGKK
jgi:hypothetical protein